MTPPLMIGHTTALQLLKDAVPPGSVVVDAGAFPGRLTRAMHAAGYKVIALDKDPSRVIGIQERFMGLQHDGASIYAEEMRAAGIDSRAFDLEVGAYPVDTGTADAIVFTEVIEHLYVDPLNALSEANRVLKPGGVCLMSTPNLLSLRNRVRLLRGRMGDVIEHPALAFFQKHAIGHTGHVRLYAPQELADMLRVFGFESTIHFRAFDFWDSVDGQPAPTGATPDAPPEAPAPKRKVRRPSDYGNAVVATVRVFLERRVPQFRAHMFVVARKTRDVRLETLTLPDVKRALGH
jgi:SAM-dependent methyltransferase